MTSDVTRGKNRSTLVHATLLMLMLPFATLCGCERHELPGSVRKTVTVNELPPEILTAARKALPGVTFYESWQNIESATSNLHSYEIKGRTTAGKIREVRVSPTGEILEME